MNEKQLLELKEDIEESKTQASELKGKFDLLNKQLKDEWGCSSLKEAGELLKTKQTKAEKLQVKIDEQIEELEQSEYFTNE